MVRRLTAATAATVAWAALVRTRRQRRRFGQPSRARAQSWACTQTARPRQSLTLRWRRVSRLRWCRAARTRMSFPNGWTQKGNG
eukprot:3432528-Prymnesium_polylepis.1